MSSSTCTPGLHELSNYKKERQAVASSMRTVSWGSAQKTAHEKITEVRREEASSNHCFLFSHTVFRTEPQLTERLEEARQAGNLKSMSSKTILLGISRLC